MVSQYEKPPLGEKGGRGWMTFSVLILKVLRLCGGIERLRLRPGSTPVVYIQFHLCFNFKTKSNLT